MTNTAPVKIVKASAGSGKTFSLTAHYISLLFKENSSFSQILALTFTNKATAEMKHRILSVLESLARGDDHYVHYKNVVRDVNPHLQDDDIQSKARQIYRQILHRYGSFAVTTIDGFVQKIIRSFSYELEIGSAYRLEMNIDKVKKDLAQRLNKLLNERADLLQWIITYAREQIENGKHWNYTHTLLDLANEIFKERYQAFHDAVSPLKSNDRATLFETIDQINREKIRAFEESFASYFTKAKQIYTQHAVDMTAFQGKSRNLIPKLANLNETADFFSFYDKLSAYIDTPEKWQAKGLDGAMQALYTDLNPLFEQIQQFYQENAPAYFLAQALKENIYYLNLLQEMSSLLRDYREDNGVMLISESQSLLREINKTGLDNTSFIWEKVGTHFKHLLFDEFQDTSSSQWSNFVPLMLNLLAERTPNTALADHLIVGDIKQSIYRWRSGDWTLLDNKAANDLGIDLIQEHTLQENYRSLDNIIDFNNFLYEHGPQWLQAQLNEKVRSGMGDYNYENWWLKEGLSQQITAAYQTSFQEKPPRKQQKNNGGKVCVKVLPLEKGNRSSRQHQTKQQALLHMGNTVLTWISSRQYLPGQIGILVRTNKEAQEVIEHLLAIQQNLTTDERFNVISGEALLLVNNRAIKLIINSLKAMVTNPSDSATFKANCLYLFHQKEDEAFQAENAIWFNLGQHTDINTWGSSLPDLLKQQWESIQLRPLSELVEFLIKAYCLDKKEADIPFLLAFKDLVESFTMLGEQGLRSFLNYWEEDGIKKALPASEGTNAIEILTIHKSKGLAFDVVMIPFCSWSLDTNHLRDFWIRTESTDYTLLKSVPVKYNANKIGKSSMYRAYYEEMLFNYLDALNMLYVATTRTICELYISVPGGSSTPNLIADLLIQVLEQFHSELSVDYQEGITFPNDRAPFEPQVMAPQKKNIKKSLTFWKHKDEWNWTLNQYPINEHLNKALDSKKMRSDLLLLGEQDPNVRLGLILHEVLSKTNRQQDIMPLLRDMQTAGTIKTEEISFLKMRASSIFENEDLKKIFGKNYLSLNEQSILDESGRIFRPDKVLSGTLETIILDFKFTGKKSAGLIDKDHVKQIKEYQHLLQQMGYPNVQAFLYYAFFDTLVAV